MAETHGIISLACGQKHNGRMPHIDELRACLQSIQENCPHLPTTVWVHPMTSLPGTTIGLHPALVPLKWWEAYKRAKNIPWKGKFAIAMGFKLLSLMASPYDVTIWLDSECYVLQPLVELFEGGFDVAMARDYGSKGVTTGFNGGVIVIRRSAESKKFLDAVWNRWRANYTKMSDQRVLTDLIKERRGGIRFKRLDHEIYNVRPSLANSLPVAKRKHTKILHSRGHVPTGDERVWEAVK